MLVPWTIAILTVYKQFFWYLNFANHRTKESFVSTANKPLVGTLMTIGDATVSIAIAWKWHGWWLYFVEVKLTGDYPGKPEIVIY